jgi:hypothetical protein
MKNTSDFWSTLDSMGGGAALLADWQASFDPHFASILPFLRATTRQAESYPCPARPPCECRHVVRETSLAHWAVCTCAPGECDPVRLEPRDLMVHAFDRREFGNAICRWLGFAEADATAYSSHGVQEIGTYKDSGDTLKRELRTAPVYFAFARQGALLIELEKLFVARPSAFVLLTLTPSACTAEINSALQRHDCAHLALSVIIPILPTPPLTLIEQVRQLLAPFSKRLAEPRDSAEVLRKIERDISAMRRQVRQEPSPAPNEPVPEDAARRAFALVQQLDPDSRMKAPSVLTVFRLYCMEELTSDQIARKTGCSKTTVVSRLRLIRKKIGVDPASLRRFSSHLQKIEQDISDSRAEHIHRKRLIYDEGDGED